VGGTFGFTNASYTETVFATPAAAQTPGLFSIVRNGDHLPGPPWTLALWSQLTFPVRGAEGYLRGDYQYSAKQTALTAAQDPENGGLANAFPPIPSTANTMLRAGMKWAGIDLSLFAQNVFNQQPKISVVNNAGVESPVFQVITWRPRTIGVTALYRY
jgi:iron complex outermembrane recepter protein